MEKIDNNRYKAQLYTTSLMLMVASADSNIDEKELIAMEKILIKFFNIDKSLCKELIKESYDIIDKATDIYEIGSFINKLFNNKEKTELLACIFQIAYSDKNFHFMERHLIKKIANIMNINKNNLLDIKNEVLRNLC